MCSELVRVSFQDAAGAWILETGVLENVGPRGVGVSLEIPLEVGIKVQLVANRFCGRARVRHCEFDQYAYSVGLEFSDGYTWDCNDWEPEHLLSLPETAAIGRAGQESPEKT